MTELSVEFEKYMISTTGSKHYTLLTMQDAAHSAFLAGAAIGAKRERERCAEIAESWSGQWFTGDKAKEIARTIKGESQ